MTRARVPTGMPAPQRGIALFVVLVMLLLGTLLVAWSARNAHYSELVTGNEADYQRALRAAEAMVRDAELDIRGQQPDGTPCRSAPGHEGSCRPTQLDLGAGHVFFPQDVADLDALTAALGGLTPSCLHGICLGTRLAPEFWRDGGGAQGFDAMKQVAARYGEFTGAWAAEGSGDPLLAAERQRAWYWVEVLPYDLAAGAIDPFRPDAERPFVYRITGIAEGLRPGSMAVVQTLFVWRRADS